MARVLHNRSEEKWALVKREDSSNHKLAIFVHGYGGTYLGTWENLPQLLTSNADGDKQLSKVVFDGA
jgi:hypothetical protein